MTWPDVLLTDDQRDVVYLVEQVIAKNDTAPSDDRGNMDRLRLALVDAGVWTIGVPEELGGGGAPLDLRLTALASLGSRWTALAWAAAQTHAAVEVLADDPSSATLLQGVLAGITTVCVLDRDSTLVDLRQEDGKTRGRIHRLDPAGPLGAVLLIGLDDTTVLRPEVLSTNARLERAGMPGAMTVSALVDGPTSTVRPTGTRVAETRRRLQLAGAAIAAGLAVEAAGRAEEYSRSRVQFGAPLTALGTVRRSLFEQRTRASAALERALSAPDTPDHAAAALVDNCEDAVSISAAAIQSLGGYGYLAEYVVEARFRDALSLRAATDSQHHARTAAAVMTPNTAGPIAGPSAS